MPSDDRFAITPETKVGELLDSYPDLEATLVALAPAFSKLRNPVLRKTVAKVTSLRQAARVGGISLGKMINDLRAAVGVEELFQEKAEAQTASAPPEWYDPARVSRAVDLRPMLERGEKPVALVLGHLNQLQPGELYEITAPFVPAPLIDLAKTRGYEAWWIQEGPEAVQVVFWRAGDLDELRTSGSTLVELE